MFDPDRFPPPVVVLDDDVGRGPPPDRKLEPDLALDEDDPGRRFEADLGLPSAPHAPFLPGSFG